MSSTSTLPLLRRLWGHLEHRRRRQFVLLLILMSISAFAEVLSLGAVIPFIGVLAAPERVWASGAGQFLAQHAGLESAQDLVAPLTGAFIAAALLAAVARISVNFLSTRLTFATGVDLSLSVYRRTLYQPYSVHIARSSSEMISGITAKIGHTTLGIVLPLLTLLSSLVLISSIVIALILVDPMVATVAGVGFGVCYGLITWRVRKRLRRNSQLIARENTQVVKTLQEGLGGIRDVLLGGAQPIYCETYRRADRRWRLAQGDNIFLSNSPRFAMEALGMVLIAALALSLSKGPGGISEALPTLGALALGAQRMLPIMQQGYRAVASLAGNHTSFADTLDLLDQPLPPEATEPRPAPLELATSIDLEHVSFRYQDDAPLTLSDITLRIPKGHSVGIVGATGSGKSTLLDLVVGLLRPSRGDILIDGEPLDGGRILAWQQSVAYVPQSIFLTDASIAENIAFGERPSDIDMTRVRRAATAARLDDFIGELPETYNQIVGEQGVRLSGGQRQRIGIARALYRPAQVLVLDEATSALDNETEREVIAQIRQLDASLTVLIIAHRLSTVRHCDTIIEIERGQLKALGAYDELVSTSESFRRKVSAASMD